ncbi:FG-GAP repeat domain-containing protein [Candidatus Solirubrobacter pratensis]|uniref:FG-GAP repeat domain-containing protein n=1 Tax=Candidatus Solirubrobacter pratensis TaxID=1298857 RepID=UPI0004188386|nr:VCBS repeat-containing protein [Candidatus Solirubrobacter pratensis]
MCLAIAAPAFAAPARASVFPFFEPAEPLGATADTIAALDFNGDGRPDVAGISGAQGQATLVLDGEDGFAPSQTAGLGGPPSATADVAGADLDGDGRDELIATLGESGSLVVFKGRASGGLGSPDVYSVRPPQAVRGTAVAVADVDGDGDRDVVAAFGDSASVLLNDGHGALAPSPDALTIMAPYAMKLVTLGGDDDPDLVVLSGYTLTVLPGAAGAGFGAPVTYQLGAEGSALATADVNGDGRLDVGVTYQWLNSQPSSPGVLFGTADGGLTPATGTAEVGDELLLADFDGDGLIDWYTAGYQPSFLDGGQVPWARSEEPGSESALAAADFDHDGKLDVASVRYPSQTVVVRYSTGPQLVPGDANTDFAEGTVGSGWGMIAVPIVNEGGGAARDLEPVVDGDEDDFDVDMYECRGAVLAVGAQCWIHVFFHPTTTGNRSADIGVVAGDSAVLWIVTMTGTGKVAPADDQQQPPATTINIGTPTSTIIRTPPRTVTGGPRPTAPPTRAPVTGARPGAPALTRPTLTALLRSGLHFTQQFTVTGRVTWTLEYHRTVLARSSRTVAAGRTTVTLKLTGAGKRVLRSHRPATLTLRTRAALERVSTVRLRRR